MRIELEKWFQQMGYRRYQAEPEEIKVYYKFYPEGFQVCLLVDETEGFHLTPEQHGALETRILNLFYHPEGKLPGFPEGYPVYQVERLTIVIGNRSEQIQSLCSACSRVWGIFEPEQRLLIYENQPGDMFGLKGALEDFLSQGARFRELRKNNNWKKLPLITAAIAITNIIIFLLMYIGSGRNINAVYVVMHGGLFPPYVLEHGEWWRLFTSMFIHYDVEHLLNNMVIFCCVGSMLEKALGHVKYLVIYLLSGLGGAALSLFMMVHVDGIGVSAGASGAVFGMIGGLLAVVLLHKGRYSGLTGKGILFMILLSLYYGFVTAGVDNWAHIGGMIAGFVLTILMSGSKAPF